MLFLVAIFAIIIMGLIIALGVLFPSGLIQNSGLTYLTVSATGSASAAPQLATMYVLMNSTGSDAAIATSNLSLTVTKFNKTISQYILGNTSRITTEAYTLSYSNRSGFVATETVSIALPNVLNVSSIIGSLSQINNVYIQGVNTQLSAQQINSLRQQALTAAMANATNQASLLAPNKTLVVRNITVSNSHFYPYRNSFGAQAYQSPLFFSGIETVTDSVTVVFSHK